MPEIKYFWIDESGDVRENPYVLPADQLARSGNVFRFAYAPEEEKFYIQDGSYRKRLANGDKDAWHLVNEALRALKAQFGAGFLNRVYGDPPGSSIKRTLSNYRPAWDFLTEFLLDEFGEGPVNMAICEFVPDKAGDPPISIEPPGVTCAGETLDEPCIKVNRHIHRSAANPPDDVSWALLNEAVASFYLRNLPKICGAFMSGQDKDRMHRKLGDHSDRMSQPLMFAYQDGPDIKIFKAKKLGGELPDEDQIRSNGLGGATHVVLFSYVPAEKRLVFHNYTPTEMAKEPELKPVLDEVARLASRNAGVSRDDIVLSFDPSMSSPYVSKMSRYRAPWEIAKARLGGDLQDIRVVELPLSVEGGAALVRSAQEEAEKAPKAQIYRIKHGVDVKYPFILADNRTQNTGMKLGAILRAYTEGSGYGTEGLDRSPENQERLGKEVDFLVKIGMPRTDILDFFVDRGDILERAEISQAIKRSWGKVLHASSEGLQKTSAIGPSLNVNEWRHIGTQEDLNRAQHSNDKTKKLLEPYNLRKHHPAKRKSYEGLLNQKRDKDLGYMKSMEQLLRESRI